MCVGPVEGYHFCVCQVAPRFWSCVESSGGQIMPLCTSSQHSALPWPTARMVPAAPTALAGPTHAILLRPYCQTCTVLQPHPSRNSTHTQPGKNLCARHAEYGHLIPLANANDACSLTETDQACNAGCFAARCACTAQCAAHAEPAINCLGV
jgi:hypothetical protein